MLALNTESMGIDTGHDPDEAMDRPEGIPYYLLACFTTPFVGLDHNHERFVGKPGDCVLRTPGHPDYFASVPDDREGFRGDWIHFQGDAIENWIKKYDVPTDRYVSTGTPHLITALIEEVIRELNDHPPFWQESVEQLVENMLRSFSRSAKMQSDIAGLTSSERHHLQRFQALRERLRSETHSTWSVSGMAMDLGLSTSRFSALYRQFFRVSPREDLLTMRLNLAKRKLVSSGNSISEIAEACGFASIYHFSRIFKQHIGCAPSRYGR